MPHLDAYPFTESIPLPTDDELGPETAAYLNDFARDYKDARMMLGTGGIGRPMIELSRAVFRVDGVDPKIREFICLRIAKLLGGVNPWGPNLRMLDNLGATDATRAYKTPRWPHSKNIAVICWYNMFNRFLASTRVPTESEQEINDKVGDQTMPA